MEKFGRAKYAAWVSSAYSSSTMWTGCLRLVFRLQNSFFNYWAPLERRRGSTPLEYGSKISRNTPVVLEPVCGWRGDDSEAVARCGQPVWLVVLFFIPVINVLFFLALCALPPRERAEDPKARRGLDEWI